MRTVTLKTRQLLSFFEILTEIDTKSRFSTKWLIFLLRVLRRKPYTITCFLLKHEDDLTYLSDQFHQYLHHFSITMPFLQLTYMYMWAGCRYIYKEEPPLFDPFPGGKNPPISSYCCSNNWLDFAQYSSSSSTSSRSSVKRDRWIRTSDGTG